MSLKNSLKAFFLFSFLLFPGFAHAEHLLTLEIYTSTLVTLNPLSFVKNAANKVTLTLPTSEEFYNEVQEGQKLTKEFKYGSFFIGGSISNLVVKVVKKEIK